MTTDVLDEEDTNVTASNLLDAHHAVVGERDDEGFLDNCERCGLASGWVQPTTLGPDHWGHATQCTSDEARALLARLDGSQDGQGPRTPKRHLPAHPGSAGGTMEP